METVELKIKGYNKYDENGNLLAVVVEEGQCDGYVVPDEFLNEFEQWLNNNDWEF